MNCECPACSIKPEDLNLEENQCLQFIHGVYPTDPLCSGCSHNTSDGCKVALKEVHAFLCPALPSDYYPSLLMV